ncbi:CRISPR-associated helicase Cas3' [Anabaena cylindrica FACHB-243]|uniref:CRISPR-associated helicase Cas3' n=1 Tax=Anabaena TaxID=1163 RepID=UPI0002E41760|nr:MULTISPECIES: CRISPR-associated helicase Cas3' [Anabaena]MBD2418253.1 CRISPR-associated helicase Cas3' [Anabaena cylindrica FACHB-243]MBY5284540.1 CRISPR-associated helicase Cas3' [Anabaena sp. CCAP 1446/1C]MBY5311699.1 CRISPR-associated helicase Cas3' [Anabaena sp. CCAP 1446/1C]MCM2409369.1 CRISPR-associated helicase Cas3' [Anabaena sp. CCAP 1446/1C]BAY06415.1 CRISPR-associated helicase Cas3 [Anabaena cylindrica PCC 7122]
MEIIQIEDTDLQAIEGKRRRIFQAKSHPLNALEIIADIHTNQRKRVIIICNTVSQAQGLYRDLRELNHDETLNLTLLHSRFLPEHRAQKETFLKETFAENWQDDGTCYVLISTQVIEAGINITCQVMHSQLCPMNSLLQRAGRCARFQDEQGQVLVYRTIEVNQAYSTLAEADLEPETESTDKKQSFLPYPRETCESTWQVLQTHTESNQVNENVGFRTEENWINQVHTTEDLLQQQRRQNNQMQFEQHFEAAFFRGDQSFASELIRSVDSRSLFVWEETGFIDFEEEPIDPRKLMAFSVPVSTLCKVWRDSKNLEFGTDWIFKRIEAPKDKAETYSQPVCTEIKSRDSLINSIKILVNPRFIYYDENIGLLIGINEFGNGFISPPKPQRTIASEYRYNMDTYIGHLGCMWTCWHKPFKTLRLKNGEAESTIYNSIRNELLPAGTKLIKNKIFPHIQESEAAALFEILVFFAIFTHDLGKLQIKWQQVMRGWQAIAHSSFHGQNPKQHLLAHTDYNPDDKDQKTALKDHEKKHKRPNHAVESAFLARDILKQSLVPVLRDYFEADNEQIQYICHTVIMAAGRHHSAWAGGWSIADITKIKTIELHPEAQRAIAQSWQSMTRFLSQILPLTPANLSKSIYPIKKEFDLNQLNTADEFEYFHLYLLVVRALRLCDQRSVQL